MLPAVDWPCRGHQTAPPSEAEAKQLCCQGNWNWETAFFPFFTLAWPQTQNIDSLSSWFISTGSETDPAAVCERCRCPGGWSPSPTERLWSRSLTTYFHPQTPGSMALLWKTQRERVSVSAFQWSVWEITVCPSGASLMKRVPPPPPPPPPNVSLKSAHKKLSLMYQSDSHSLLKYWTMQDGAGWRIHGSVGCLS